ncbi:hypothetical protein G7Y89_g4159 [Cudoniella acicularis]|uniref:NADP-dependent oxidoreductase domain-containing protein n=1 Tax=Cudoniella acicularis TaxID=354080 RepID=A0A8H4RS39_9HELO|nr:hypothetical protein G7Y89_g4159 [Cudoniella acicularis]
MSSSLPTPPLEHSGISPRVKVILGTALFGDITDPQAKFNTVEEAREVLDIYRNRGYTEIDTARAYPVGASGSSEKLLGLLNNGDWMTLDTKVVSWAAGTHEKAKIRSSVENSLDALKTPRVHIEYLHAPDPVTPFEETTEAMNEAYKAGKFEKFGISNYSAAQVEKLCAICEKNNFVKPSVYQGQYNPISRSNEDDLFPVLRKHGISFYAYSPSAAGFFSGKVTRESVKEKGSRWDTETLLGRMYVQDYFKDSLFDAAAEVVQAAKAEGITGHEAALRWTIFHSALRPEYGDAVVIGVSSCEQLSQNLDIAEAGPLVDTLAQKIEDVWMNAKRVAPTNHSSYFDREREAAPQPGVFYINSDQFPYQVGNSYNAVQHIKIQCNALQCLMQLLVAVSSRVRGGDECDLSQVKGSASGCHVRFPGLVRELSSAMWKAPQRRHVPCGTWKAVEQGRASDSSKPVTARLTLGAYNFDEGDEERLKTEIAKIELRKVETVISKLKESFGQTNSESEQRVYESLVAFLSDKMRSAFK